MRVLIIGGTGLISRGIVKHLRARGARVTLLNRGRRAPIPDVEQLVIDRQDAAAFEGVANHRTFDAVIDMIGYTPDDAHSDIRAFAGRCGHFIFCSTVCTYGVKITPGVLVDETFPQEPISTYGRNKLAAERVLWEAHASGAMPVTIIRPSHTYGADLALIDNLEPDPVAWDRIEKGLPILCAGDGLGLWVSTHRDDCGKLFAYAAMNPKTFGESYNATRRTVLTWREYLQQVAAALGMPARVLFMPADWIVRHDPKRFGLLREITGFHGAYTSAKAERDVPEFRCDIDLIDGARQTLQLRRAGDLWRSGSDDALYEAMVSKALAGGVEPVEL
jgi:nucleoside-diphosphate-sugar epimerase